MSPATAKKPNTLRDRIAELEDEIKQRDARIRELRNDLNKAEALISEEREHVEDANALIDSWIEAFEMRQDEKGAWSFSPWFEAADIARDRYDALLKKWNRHVTLFNNTFAPRNVGRPLGASAAQVQQVRKLHKAGKSLRAIQEETNLGFQTVRTIVGQTAGRDRTTIKHLQRIDPGRLKEEPWRERTRMSLPKRITETLERGRELVKAAKGLR
jgi:hypothetical protein